MGLITDRLTADAAPNAEVATDGGGSSQSRSVTGSSEISRQDAEALMNAMWAQGLHKATIRDELVGAGMPSSWVEFRLRTHRVARRSGW
jgi:hypothetical protein